MTTDPKKPIAERYELRTERFEHGDFNVDILLPFSSEYLIDEDEFDEDERLPYWAELWPSARALARHLLDNPVQVPSALELGCGVGLPALALSWRGVDVTATDYYDDALAFTRLNAERNGLPAITTCNLDWRRAEAIGRTFPLVIAADVLYEQRNAVALAGALPALLEPGGEMILADPGLAYRGHFLKMIGETGWRAELLGERAEPLDGGGSPNIRVGLFLIGRV